MTNALQIPVTIPQGLTSKSINKITEQITLYAQFLFSQVKKEESTDVINTKGIDYIRSLRAIGGTSVPADENRKGFEDSKIPCYEVKEFLKRFK